MEKYVNIVPNSPELRCVEDKPEHSQCLHYSRFAISPLQAGQAMTMGVALRRALLEVDKSIYIVSAKIVGAIHEYSTLEGVRESVKDILLNLTQVVLKGKLDGIQIASLVAKGPGRVTAGHISLPSSLVAVDSNQYIATLTKETQLCIELVIQESKAYRSNQILDLNSDFFLIDSGVPPVRNVTFSIHSLATTPSDQELLLLEIWTNKTLTPQEALSQASCSLVNLFSIFVNPSFFSEIGNNDSTESLSEYKRFVEQKESKHLSTFSTNGIKNILSKIENKNSNDFQNLSIEELGLSPRIHNALKRADIYTMSDLLQYTRNDLLKIKNFGSKSAEQVLHVLEKRFGIML
jgi:DNA-directed RNA polymerase subunit alpha